MSECERYQDWFVEALYGDLEESRKQAFQSHLKECGPCSAEYRKLSATLSIMDQRKRTDPGPEFWTRFDSKLQERIAAVSKSVRKERDAVRWLSFGTMPRWVWSAAAAVLLVGFGIVIGKYYLARPMETPVQIVKEPPSVTSPVQRANADKETQRFLERSEILLVGLVNLDADEEGAADLSIQKKVSRDLIQDAAMIKTKLKGPDQRRLRRLVSDLELILVQIANLEAESNVPEIEIVKSGVDHKGVLMKINLEQMRMSGTVQKEPEQEAAAGDQKL